MAGARTTAFEAVAWHMDETIIRTPWLSGWLEAVFGPAIRSEQTDEVGAKAVDVVHPIQDLHVTLLRLLGLDDNKLTFFHGGRFKQLSQTGGKVIQDLIA